MTQLIFFSYSFEVISLGILHVQVFIGVLSATKCSTARVLLKMLPDASALILNVFKVFEKEKVRKRLFFPCQEPKREHAMLWELHLDNLLASCTVSLGKLTPALAQLSKPGAITEVWTVLIKILSKELQCLC